MPKTHTFPTLYDEVKQINISNLKKWGYLQPNQIKSSVISWSCNGAKTGSISILVNTTDVPFIELNYNSNDKPRHYRVYLIQYPSNLGKGFIWYFICPQTNKKCRKLYLVDGYFLHREAFKGCMYAKQTQTKKWREIEKVYGSYFDEEKHYKELHSKHFKTHYNGKPTKRYLKLIAKLKEANRVSCEDIERLFFM
ncbi:hypothetical protein [Neptunitalea lumnitzerae]|uniref:LAGLIDADG homing endonuclease n=1 Tax=Neptunitalea lumnitzerae TaxID=2965509 RepID=A0ABQ5MKH8_9FLAO|nr:hypothetical protein [Neptunitalea sp. Y10]GLB49837.1 hypothetical protein Y10_22050 [Neptunitalea sp. Y10]